MFHYRPKLIAGWHRVLFRAWSARLLYLGFGFQVLEQLLPYFDPDSFGIPPQLFRWFTIVVLIGAVWARVIPQPTIHLEKINANQNDPVERPSKGRHRHGYARSLVRWLVALVTPGDTGKRS